MGYNSYTYVGAYIEMPEVEQIKTSEYTRCSNKNCVNHVKKINSAFCDKCGKERELFKEEKHVFTVPDYYAFSEDCGLDPEKLSSVQNRKVLISNRKFGCINRWDDNEENVVEFIWGDAQKSIVDFTNEVKDFLDKFKEFYGISLKVKFGVIFYIM